MRFCYCGVGSEIIDRKLCFEINPRTILPTTHLTAQRTTSSFPPPSLSLSPPSPPIQIKARVRNKTNQEVPSLPQPPPTTTTVAASAAEAEVEAEAEAKAKAEVEAEAEASAAAAAADGEDEGFEIPGYFSTLSDADISASDRSVCAEVGVDFAVLAKPLP